MLHTIWHLQGEKKFEKEVYLFFKNSSLPQQMSTKISGYFGAGEGQG
jgi:hypothetical protein